MIASSIDKVSTEVTGYIAVITLNRPAKLNAVTPDMSKELTRLAHEINDDPAIRVVVLTGAGERAFCAGSDIRTLDDYATPWEFRNRVDYCDALRELYASVSVVPIPANARTPVELSRMYRSGVIARPSSSTFPCAESRTMRVSTPVSASTCAT